MKRIIIEVLGIKQFSLPWIPHGLMAAQKAQPVVDSRKLFRVLMVDPASGFVNLITAHENRYCWSYDPPSQYNTSRDLVPTRPLKKSDSKTSMFTVMFSGHGLLALGNLPGGLKMNSQYFWDVVLEEAGQAVIAITKKSGI
jgi:hypothetical protein